MVFSEYIVSTEETGAVFFTFVLVYTGFAYILIAPLVSWGRYYSKGTPGPQNEDSKPDLENEPDPATSGETEAAQSEALSSTKMTCCTLQKKAESTQECMVEILVESM